MSPTFPSHTHSGGRHPDGPSYSVIYDDKERTWTAKEIADFLVLNAPEPLFMLWDHDAPPGNAPDGRMLYYLHREHPHAMARVGWSKEGLHLHRHKAILSGREGYFLWVEERQ